MANMLAWLTGRDDQSATPSPVQYGDGQPSLTAYHPSPSEQFGNWISDALGAGPNASLAHQNFAQGVPSVLSLFPPLGVGLSAADFAHARAANDPVGAAAAAIGLIPGAGPEARAGMQVVKKAVADAPNFEKWLQQTVNSSLPSKEGYTLSSAANKDFPEAAKDYFVHDPTGNKVGELTHVAEEIRDKYSTTPAHWQLSMEGVAPKAGSSLDDLMNYIPGWHKQTITEKGAKLPVLDYEKDDNGLYHIFDAMTGKTLKVVDSDLQAKQFIKGGQSVPITSVDTPPLNETKAPDLLEAEKRYDAAIAPLAQNLPERAQAQGYTTPAFRGLRVYQGEGAPNPVFNYEKSEHQYSTADPMLADMYSSYLSSHPGWNVPKDAFYEGAQVSPLLLDTSNYHYYDAKGAHWASSMGNMRGIKEAQTAGKPGVIIDNVWDEPNSSTRALGSPKKIFITFPEGATSVKSRFAERFDPTSPNMLHSLAGLGAGAAGATALGEAWSPSEANAAAPQKAKLVQPQSVTDKINDIMGSLDWQGQWMDRMRLPLQRAADKMKETAR